MRAHISCVLAASLQCGAAGMALAEQPAAQQSLQELRGDAPAETPRVSVRAVATGLNHPWSMAFLPDDEGVLITERVGNLRMWRPDSGLSAPIKGLPTVYAKNQGGLLDIALAPDFAQSRRVYLSYAEPGEGGRAGTAVGFGVLSRDGRRLEQFEVIFRQMPKLSTGHHFGSRLVFDQRGHLFVTLGENNQRPTAQRLDQLQGKVVRLLPDGAIPKDNPFHEASGARPEVWSFGHRNPQGAALNPWTGQLWVNEHGPRGGDEINIVRAGGNYGWPLATYGINYSGLPIPEARGTSQAGMVEPAYYWKVSPAISGMAFYDAPRYPSWQHSVFIGALKDQSLIRLALDGDRVVGEERLLTGEARIRDVRVAPDGRVYILTDSSQGAMMEVAPGG
ncbi:PQQ-dependent sugar dehydrogenase [Allopusillimonas soli]|nr:PQQ-dependent sugar dehydrogenase [Allopusillimonas soli]